MNGNISAEDDKNFRKYRKYLRQIEHLQMLARPLNSEEKLKLSKKAYYREQLDALKVIYGSANLSLRSNKENNSDESNVSNEFHNVTEEKMAEPEDDNEECDELNHDDEVAEEEEEEEKDQPIQEQPTSKEDLNEKIEEKHVKEEEEEQKKKRNKKSKLKVNYRRKSFKSIHDDLIVCLDIFAELGLIVTGSRDTTIRAWQIDDDENIRLVQSYGGHSGSVTCVRFWCHANFMSFMEKLVNSESEKVNEIEQENARNILNEFNSDESDKRPFIISSSLDCSIRIWCLEKAMCIKEIYMYNPVNHFCLCEASFAVGLTAGKLELWKNGLRKFNTRAYEDSESVCHVEILKKKDVIRLYSLTQNGLLKIFDLVETTLESNFDFRVSHGSYVLDNLPDNTNLFKLTFKSFEILSEDKLILICNHQSFVILYDVNEETSKPISTNMNRYGITNCISKCDEKILMNAYDIDDSRSVINVFEQSESSDIKYKYTLSNDSGVKDNCISTLVAKIHRRLDDREVDYIMASSSSRDLSLWFVENRFKANPKMKSTLVDKSFGIQIDSNDFTTIGDDDSDDSVSESATVEHAEINDDDDDEEEGVEEVKKESKSYCSIQ